MISITLPDGNIKAFESAVSGRDLALSISEGLARNSVAMELDGRSQILSFIAVRCRIPVDPGRSPERTLVGLIHHSPDQFLDVVDLHLQTMGGGSDLLETYLGLGESAWTVAKEPRPHLERRVPDEERRLYQVASTPADDASAELQEAWGKVCGRDPNPSDAWDHAIKAVEILLHPIVSPSNLKATLGSMLAVLESQPEKWALTLVTSSKTVGPVEALTGMLRLIWPNPDRHGSGAGATRVPTQEEAEQVVRLAVFVVSWLRTGALQAVAPAAGATGSP